MERVISVPLIRFRSDEPTLPLMLRPIQVKRTKKSKPIRGIERLHFTLFVGCYRRLRNADNIAERVVAEACLSFWVSPSKKVRPA